MIDMIIYLFVVTMVSYAIMAALFDGHLFISFRTFFTTLRDKAADRHHKMGYFIGYLGSCYFCMSYWVSWFVAFLLYMVLFRETLPLVSAITIVLSSGLFSAAILDIVNNMFPGLAKPDYGRKHFFPWHEEVNVVWDDGNDDYEDEEEENIAEYYDLSDSSSNTPQIEHEKEEKDDRKDADN